MLKKKIMSAILAVAMSFSAFAGVVSAEEDATLGFDANKSWANMNWVVYGSSGGTGDATRNFTMTNEAGKELSFTLVETYDSDDAKYWIIANDRYGTKATGTSVKYDPTAEGSIAKYVNGAFVQSGAWDWNLPEAMIDTIDYDHVWATEKAHAGEVVTEAYTFTAGVVIPAVWEMEKYGDRMMIDFLPAYNGANYVFRTALSDGYYHGLKPGSNGTNDAGVSKFQLTALGASAETARGIRPEFFVNSDFFKTGAVDLATAGSLIKAEISNHSYADLSKIYTDEEISTYLPEVVIPPHIDVLAATTDGKDATVGNTLKVTVEGAEGTPEYQWYAGDDLIDGATSDTYVLTYNEHEKDVKCFVTVDGAEVESNAVAVTSQFDETKKWANMNWVSYGTSGGMGDSTRNFTMKNEFGKELSFTLVEIYNNEESKYWIIANDRYGTKHSGTSVKYDPTVADTIANFTNAALVQKTPWEWNLPQAVIDALDYDHVWITEMANAGETVKEPYTFKAGVVIPAIWEMWKYGDRMIIDFPATYNGANYVFRTALSDAYYHGIKYGTNKTGATGISSFQLTPLTANATDARGVRPEFFVNSDFFKNAKVDLATAGSVVKAEIAQYSYEDLSKLYTDAEIDNYLGIDVPTDADVSVTWTDGSAVLESLTGVETVSADITIDSRSDKATTAYVSVALYDKYGSLVKMGLDTVSFEANETGKGTVIELTELSGLTEDYTLKLFVWDSSTLNPRCEAIELKFDNIETPDAQAVSLNMTTGEQVFFGGVL